MILCFKNNNKTQQSWLSDLTDIDTARLHKRVTAREAKGGM